MRKCVVEVYGEDKAVDADLVDKHFDKFNCDVVLLKAHKDEYLAEAKRLEEKENAE